MSETNARVWHVAAWGWPGIAETLIKSVAIIIGIMAGLAALQRGDFAMPSGWPLLQWLILLLLSLGLLVAIAERYQSREIPSMIFVIPNNLAHWGMLLALTTVQGPGQMLLIYVLLMLLGDLVKLWAIAMTDFPVKTVSRRILLGLTGFYALGYALLALFEIIQP